MSAAIFDLFDRYLPSFPRAHCGRLVTDTTQFMGIGYGDVIALNDLHYLVLRDEAERRFGMEDPKYWVKRCRVLETGERKILKLVFYEEFPMHIGSFTLRCHRTPEKEARILDLVRGDKRFMQGVTVKDEKGNCVRILDIVNGKRLDLAVDAIPVDHPTYFREHFPDVLAKYISACEAIGFLHSHWEKHGDVRRDHLFVEYETGQYRWIDFDYAFDFRENPFGLDIFGLGNILQFIVGKGVHSREYLVEKQFPTRIVDSLAPEDFSLMFAHRLVNFRKIYPYVPEALNHVLMHFSAGSEVFYESVDELLADLRPCLDVLRRGVES